MPEERPAVARLDLLADQQPQQVATPEDVDEPAGGPRGHQRGVGHAVGVDGVIDGDVRHERAMPSTPGPLGSPASNSSSSRPSKVSFHFSGDVSSGSASR